jgi:predicted transcriptional regulator
LSTKTDQLEWRRSKVIDLRSRGLSYGEIAHELQVSKASITSDVQYLREQAKGTIKEYVTEHLPEQYQLCLTALDTILKQESISSIVPTSSTSFSCACSISRLACCISLSAS